MSNKNRQSDSEPFRFGQKQREQILRAIDGALDLKNNAYARGERYGYYHVAAGREVGRNPKEKSNFISKVYGSSEHLIFIDHLEFIVEKLMTERAALASAAKNKDRKRGRPPKLPEDKDPEINFARRLALLCRDLLEITPTTGRSHRLSDRSQFAERGGFFDRILRIGLDSAGCAVPRETFRLLKKAIDWIAKQPSYPDLYVDLVKQFPLGRYAAVSGEFRGNEADFKKLDKLTGLEYETALTQLTPAQQESYLDTEEKAESATSSNPINDFLYPGLAKKKPKRLRRR